jgi:hypothetical protein
MKKSLVAALICGTSVVGVGVGSAFAGEVTGNNTLTPVNEGRANSACAFSGLEDNDDLSAPVEPGVVQTFGSVGPSQTPGPVVAEVFAKTGLIREIGPGTQCRGGGPGGD